MVISKSHVEQRVNILLPSQGERGSLPSNISFHLLCVCAMMIAYPIYGVQSKLELYFAFISGYYFVYCSLNVFLTYTNYLYPVTAKF